MLDGFDIDSYPFSIPAIADLILFCFRYVYQKGNMKRTNNVQGRYRPQNADSDPHIS